MKEIKGTPLMLSFDNLDLFRKSKREKKQKEQYSNIVKNIEKKNLAGVDFTDENKRLLNMEE